MLMLGAQKVSPKNASWSFSRIAWLYLARASVEMVWPIWCTSGASQVAALLLHADAYDLLASRVVHATLPVPDDLARQLAPASPDVRAEIEHQYHDRIAAALVDQVRPVHCMAAVLYRRVLTIDSTNARAIAQLAAYGDAFVRSCD